MVFSSIEFIFRFMPIFFLCYFLVPQKGENVFRNLLLFLGSVVFYAIGEPIYVCLILASVIINYFGGQLIKKTTGAVKKMLLTGVLVVDFGALFVFKYYNFFVENVNLIGGEELLPVLQLTLPLGISFYTFQMASYVVDVYRGNISEKGSFLSVATYVVMFPQLIAGPIVKYQEVEIALRERVHRAKDVEGGLKVFCLGLASKVLLANQISLFWNQVQGIGFANLSTEMAWLGALSYSFQIYFDFWGYSLMAIGLGKMLGFQIPKNFDCPYMVRSITEFWRKWHMTLGRFFREYVYFPLGGNRRGKLRNVLNLAIVWALTGLWHGASWNFVLWGVTFFVLLVLEKNIYGKLLDKVPVIGHLYVWAIIPATWMIFAITDMNELVTYLGKMVGYHLSAPMVGLDQLMRYLSEMGWLFVLCAIMSTGLPMAIWRKIKKNPLSVVVCLALFWLSVYKLATSVNNPFLYFRF